MSQTTRTPRKIAYASLTAGTLMSIALLGVPVPAAGANAATETPGAAIAQLSANSPYDPSAGWTQALQDQMDPFIRQIYAVVGTSPGYADLRLDFTSKTIQVMFHGAMPSSLSVAATQMRANGLDIAQIDVPYGEAELDAAIVKLGNSLRASGIRWDMIGPSSDYSHLEVAGKTVSVDPDVQQQARAIAAQITSIPVSFAADDPAAPTDTRLTDTSPYIGGARLNVNGLPECTTGLAMIHGTQQYLLTAAHCADFNDNVTFQNGASQTIGPNRWSGVLLTQNELDATLILPNSNSTLGRIYSGPYNTGTNVGISGVEPWAQGYQACLSGSVGGNRCTVQRIPGDVTRELTVCNASGTVCETSWEFEVEPVDGGTRQIVAGGDSGGPWTNSANGEALGIQSAAPESSELLTCDGNTDPNLRATDACYDRAYVVPINRIADALSPYGIVFRTG